MDPNEKSIITDLMESFATGSEAGVIGLVVECLSTGDINHAMALCQHFYVFTAVCNAHMLKDYIEEAFAEFVCENGDTMVGIPQVTDESEAHVIGQLLHFMVVQNYSYHSYLSKLLDNRDYWSLQVALTDSEVYQGANLNRSALKDVYRNKLWWVFEVEREAQNE